MIHEVDESLRLLMRQEALQGTDIDILFETPTKEWASRRNTPTIDVFLYDIREDVGRREEGVIDIRGEDGKVVARRRPPRYYKLSYLVTAWTQRPEDEHRLLSACMALFLKHGELPKETLVGSLKDLGLLIMVNIALPPPHRLRRAELRRSARRWRRLSPTRPSRRKLPPACAAERSGS